MLNLEPQSLWYFFDKITKIPRPSKHEEKIITFLQNFAAERNLDCKTDKAGNVLIYKQATAGYENLPAIILQAHTDMVCEKNRDIDFDFAKDAINYYIDGDFVKARGTTLGADNGIGIAMILSILDSRDLAHPALEGLFTVDEETGLTGAFALEKNFLTGKTLINLDSEDDGEIFVGCAGGVDTVGKLPFYSEKTPENYFSFKISIEKLKGGHSGDDINKGRGNANKIIGRFLWSVSEETDLYVAHFDGGNLRNAIPREAYSICCVPNEYKEKLRAQFNVFVADLKEEYRVTDPDFVLDIETAEKPEHVMTRSDSFTLLNLLYALPHGVKTMSADIAGLVETSTNLASVKFVEDAVEITTSQRSSIESAKWDIARKVAATLLLANAGFKHGDGYPGWKPNLNSAILKKAETAYFDLFHEKAKVRAIHAGLECGLFLEKYPSLDMISIGPQMYDVHSPDERLSISSTQKCFEWLKRIIDLRF